MKNTNRQKIGEEKSNTLSSSIGTSQNANFKRPIKSKSITHYETSDGAINHQKPMERTHIDYKTLLRGDED